MAYKYKVSDLKNSTIKQIAGVCLDSQSFLDTVNEVQRRLMRRGNFFDIEQLIRLCVHDACITWPRYVGTVLGARLCDGSVAEIKNKWYSILGGARGLNEAGHGYDLVLEDSNPRPIYRQVRTGTVGKKIRYYIRYQNDVGKTIKIYGKQYGGQPLQELDSTGAYVDGITLTATSTTPAESDLYVTEITSVVREATQGMAFLYEYDDVTGSLRDLAMYEPNETNPRYRSSVIRNFCCAPGCNETVTVSGTDYTRRQVHIEAIVKLEHFDVTNDNDFLLIDNFEAFKFGFQAVKLEEANDDERAEVKFLKAVRELNFEDRDKNPAAQTAVRMSVVGGTCIHSPD